MIFAVVWPMHQTSAGVIIPTAERIGPLCKRVREEYGMAEADYGERTFLFAANITARPGVLL
jgi:hypothetical protein